MMAASRTHINVRSRRRTMYLRNSFISHLRLITVRVLACGTAAQTKSLEAVTTLKPHAAALARRIHS
jgi:hypothetical protein